MQSAKVCIKFPCPNYPIKVIGEAGEDFAALVLSVVQRYAEVEPDKISCRDSKNGRFQSVQLHICASGIEQLQAINSALRETGRVQMVL